jgi:adenylate cyclase
MSVPLQNLIIMFADINGSVALYQKHGDKTAQHLVGQCMQRLKEITESSGGRAVRLTGDGVLATFKQADDALRAATAMMKAVAEIPTARETGLGIHIGFHYGSLMAVEGDLYGDSVNLAARVASLAQPGQIKTTEETVAQLSPAWKSQVRCIGPLAVKGRREPAIIYEFVGEAQQEHTTLRSNFNFGPAGQLVLKSGEIEIVMTPQNQKPFIFGRSPECDICVSHQYSSRQHARVEVRGTAFFLVDHSANGTHVLPDGGDEIVLRHQDLALQGTGLIALGCTFDPDRKRDRYIEYQVQRA